uniref:Uncharacterized protein n=1 Tax=viral metagenome TaxID=1070528 RepID=A0A6C0CXG9_9ZZZZ
MSDIYKVCELNDSNNISKITVFYGNTDLDIQKLFLENPSNSIFENVFSKSELDNISTNNIPVQFTSLSIYSDDTIQNIKKKIISAYSNSIAFEEMYLFSKQIQNVNNISIYDALTHNNYFSITQDILLQFLSNINDFNIEGVSFKEKYEFNDIIDLNISEKILVDIPLGQHIITGNDIFNFTINPYRIISFTKVISSYTSNLISTSNKELLLSSGFIYENNIYLCNAKDILKNSISKNLSEKTTTSLYLPFLEEKNIDDLKKLNNEHITLLEKSKNLISTNFIKQNDNISLFYDIYNSRKSELSYIQQGIKRIQFIIHQPFSFNLPLDIVFKLIHATKLIPFIKFNPSKKKENIYRLYCNRISKNEKKIPYLSKSQIFKLMKNIKGSKKVSCYIEFPMEDTTIPIILEFDSFANIIVSLELKKPLEISSLDKLFISAINPVIKIIQEYTANSGYKIVSYNNLYDNNVEILKIDYNSYISIEKNINLNSLVGCVSSVFNILVGELQKGIVLRYKRVANFNEMESTDAFIVELLNRANDDDDIIDAVVDNFQLTEMEAKLKIAELLNSLQVVQSLGKKSLKIKNNPGFLTKITQDQFKQNIMIEMENINNIFYLNVIPIYLDSIIRITQFPETSNIPISTIDSLCKVKQVEDEDDFEEIIAPSEKPVADNIPVGIVAQDLTFGVGAEKSKEKTINVMDFLFEDDDDEDEEEEEEDDEGIEVELPEEEIMKGGEDSDDEGIDVDLDSDDEGIDVDLDSDDEGIDVDLDSDDEGIDIEPEDEDKDEGIDVDLDEGIDVDLDEETPIKTKTPTPPKEKTPTPPKEKTPTPPKEKTPTPPKEKTPTPPKEKTPTPPKEKTPTPPKEKTPTPPKEVLTIKKKSKKLKIQDEEKIKSDITGMKIADPNPFFRSMYNKDPILFLTESDGKYNSYSRACPWNKRRQPVILTDKEKEKIDKEHPGSYEHAIKYGSSPDKKYWYICPRYWDLKRNISLTEEEVKSGKYGNIIPEDAKVVPPGANIFQFKGKEHQDKDGNYKTHNPGFLKEDAHPDGLCVPCCFKNWDKDSQIKRREKCLSEESKEEKTQKSKSKDKAPAQLDEYIKGPDKFPLEQGRFGYLPFIIQTFIGTDNKQCQISATNTNLKKDYPCYLRVGVENNKNKSFLGVIADIYSQYNNNKTMNIQDFTNKLISILTLDIFVEIQNGNLINLFKREYDKIKLEEINIPQIKNSKIYEKFITNNNQQLKSIISSYLNFIDYLSEPTSFVNYEFIWDLICMKNPNLFPEGINLIILEMPQDDVTANLNIICPTNFYSINKYDDKKETVIIMKKYEYFEPINIVIDKAKTTGTSYRTTKLFNSKLMNSIPNLKNMKTTIKDIYNSMCKPLPSVLNIADKYNFKTFKFKRNKVIKEIIKILDSKKLPILNLVLNYDNKVIGLITEINSEKGFIPSFPSEILDYPLIYFDDEKMNLKNFENTVKFLTSIKKFTNNEILCQPVVKVLEDKLIVGLLTETNQFIELIEPEQNTDITIKDTIDDENFYNVNKKTQLSDKIDEERIIFIKKIQIETELYNKFRNKLKYLLSNYNNKNLREIIESLSNTKYMLYYNQLDELIKQIKKLMNKEVEFVDSKDLKLFDKETTIQDVLNIPKVNLMNNLDNEEIYYSKVADELIRYNRIKMFMFEPKVFLSFSDIKYNLNDDEIILLQSLLTQDYFEDLVPKIDSKYINFNTYDTVEPNLSVKYDNEFIKSSETKIDTKNKMKEVLGVQDRKLNLGNLNCKYEIKDVYSKLLLKFRGGFKEINFGFDKPECSFDVALVIIKNFQPSFKISIDIIKQILIEEYESLIVINKRKVIDIISYYGKVGDDKKIDVASMNIEEMIKKNDYLLNIFDLLLLSNKLKFPLALISPKRFKENKKEYLTLNISKGETYIVRTPVFNKYRRTVPKYKLIINKNNEGLIEIKNIPNENIRKQMLEQSNTVKSLLEGFDETEEEIKGGKLKHKIRLT